MLRLAILCRATRCGGAHASRSTIGKPSNRSQGCARCPEACGCPFERMQHTLLKEVSVVLPDFCRMVRCGLRQRRSMSSLYRVHGDAPSSLRSPLEARTFTGCATGVGTPQGAGIIAVAFKHLSALQL